MQPTFESRLAINGMGRIGRTLLRILYQKGLIGKVVALNDVMSKENLVYLLKYDSIRGQFPAEITATSGGIKIDGHELAYSQANEIAQIPWKGLSIDTVVEATGYFTHSSEAGQHFTHGTKRVLLSTFSKDLVSTVLGVNHDASTGKIISPGDCTINCTAPLINLLNKTFGVESIHINVIHHSTRIIGRRVQGVAPRQGCRSLYYSIRSEY